MTKQYSLKTRFKGYLEFVNFKGCSDISCLCKNNKQGTNGGCKCLNKLSNIEVKKLYHHFMRFLEMIDNNTEYEYLDQLIAESKEDMDKIKDPEQWLKEVRGYEN